MAHTPFISVIIPVKEINYFILFENLPAFEHQSYQHFEVIVLPNQHTQYDLELLRKYKWLRIIPTGKITRPAEKRDLGVKEAKGDIVAFIDDDAYPTPTWLEKAVGLFESRKTAAVCGPGIVPKQVNIWEKIFDEVLRNFIGSGGYSYRFFPRKERYVDDYPSMNFLIHKNIFQKIGGFNSAYWPGEDSKLCNDLVYKEKEKIFYSPEVVIYHHRRNEMAGYLRQHGNYGYHRGAFFAHGDANSKKPGYLIPTLFVVYLAALLIMSLFNFIGLISPVFAMLVSVPLLLYGVGEIYLFLSAIFHTGNPIVGLGTVFILFFTHLIYGIMFIKGFYRGLTKKTAIYD